MITLQSLLNGYSKFQKHASPEEIAQLKRLRDGQSPEVLMITCSDSRVHLERILQYKPGEVFTIRNAGNVVPGLNSEARGELGTLQFAVEVLKIKNIVVCGHSDCGAVKAALNPTVIETLPHLKSWIAEAKDGFNPCNDDDLNSNIQLPSESFQWAFLAEAMKAAANQGGMQADRKSGNLFSNFFGASF